jgi:hypothetical protein
MVKDDLNIEKNKLCDNFINGIQISSSNEMIENTFNCYSWFNFVFRSFSLLKTFYL